MSSILKSLKLLSDPTRLRLLLLLHTESLSVAELQEILGMGQSRISTQLSQLKSEGLIDHEKSGKNHFYRSTASPDIILIAQKASPEIPECEQDTVALRHLLRKRKDKARAYFDKLAGKFGKEYVPGRSWKGLAEGLIGILNYDTVVDLGAGEGTIAQLIAPRAKKVIAVDLSPKMVEHGTALAAEHGLHNLEYRLGDIENPPLEPRSVDLMIFSQALHHAERPERAIKKAYENLKPGGRVLILDLLQHRFEEARDLYSDRWLGFSEVKIAEMLEQAGFKDLSITLVDREEKPPYFQTILASAIKKDHS